MEYFMRIQTIKDRSRNLAAQYAALDVETASLREKTVMIYKKTKSAQLNALLTENETNESDLISALESHLTENWSLIQGTSLCYTALPNDEMTQLLVDIAQHIADEKKRFTPEADETARTPIHLLMPTIALESAREGFPNLGPDVDILQVLQTHVLGNGGLYLLPVRLVTELTLEADATKKINNPYYDLFKGHPENAAYVDQEESSRLMEHSPLTQAVFDTQAAYEFIASDTHDLLGQLRLLCRKLGMNSSHGGIGQAGDAAAGAYPAIIHFMEYYNKIFGHWLFRLEEIPTGLESYKNSYLWVAETLYYVNHDAVLDNVSITNLGLFKQKLNNLFDTERLKEPHQIPLSVIHMHELITTNGGHNPLHLDETKKLPPALQQEIYKLLELTTQKTVNVNATAQLETCIYTRRAALLAAMRGHETALSDISLRQGNKRILVDKALRDFKAAIDTLTHAVESKNYSYGYAKLGVDLTLIETLRVPLFIRSLGDLNLIQSLSAAEITNVCQSEHLKQQIMTRLANIENLVIFLMDLSLEKTTAFLTALEQELLQHMIRTPQNVSELLISFDAEKCETIVNVFHAKIKTGENFLRLISHLEPEQRIVVFNTLKDHLQDFIKNTLDFRQVMHHLKPEQRIIMCNNLKDHMQDFVKNADDFTHVMSTPSLTQELRTVIFNALKDHIQNVIKNAKDFNSVMRYLSLTQRTVIIHTLKNQIPHIIKNADDFKDVMTELPSELRTVVLNVLKNRMQHLVKNARDFSHVMECYTLSRETAVDFNPLDFDPLKDHKQKIIRNAKDRTVVFNALKDRMQDLIQNTEDFKLVMKNLTRELGSVVLNCLKKREQHIIKTALNFGLVMDYCSTSSERSVIFNALKDHFQDIIQNAKDFSDVMCELTPKQRTVVFKTLKDHLQGFITNAKNFNDVIVYLTPEQCTVVCSDIKNRMKNIIKDRSNAQTAMSCLEGNQRIVIFKALKDHLQDVIKSADDFRRIMSDLAPAQRIALCNAMHNTLVYLIQSKTDYSTLLEAMNYIEVQPLLDAKSLYDAIQSLPSIVSDRQRDALLSALVTHDHKRIKTQIDAILMQNRTNCRFFTALSHKENLLNAFALLQPYWLKPISEALEINHTIKAFSEYVNHPLAFREPLKMTQISMRVSL